MNSPLKKILSSQVENVMSAKDRAGLSFFISQAADQWGNSIYGDLNSNLISSNTSQFQKTIHNLTSIRSPSAQVVSNSKSLPEKIYDATAEVKILTAQVAMYLTRSWRDRVFKQIDHLHDLSEWDLDANPIQKESFRTFLKAMIALKPTEHPGLGLSDKGFLLAAWISDNSRLTTEFLPNDQIKWSLSVWVGSDDEVDRAAGITSTARLLSRLSPYTPEKWFYDKATKKR